jgi:hypothetical protein
VIFRITSWRAATLLAILTLFLGIPAAASASSASSASAAAPAAASTGWITLANLSETSPAVDVYVYPSGSSTPQLVLRDVGYGTVSAPDQVSVGGYRVKMLIAGASVSSQPLLSAGVNVAAGHSYTMADLTVASQAKQLQVIDNSLTTPSGKSLVRVIQASFDQKSVKFYCSCGGYITTNAAPGSVSSYAPIPPGTWTMTATGASSKASTPVTLTADTVHTEVVIDGPNGIEIENLVDAAGPGEPPAGGVGTGFGGTAGHGPGSSLPWLAVIGAGALLAVAGGLRLRRSVPRVAAAVTRVPSRM